MPHAANSLHDLARKAMHTPQLLDKKERMRLSEHVLKERDKATDIEIKAAQDISQDPDGASEGDISLLGRKVAGVK